MELGVRRLPALSLLLSCAALLAGCGDDSGFPRDPKGTLLRVRGGTMRVALVENPPWVVRNGDEAAGIEPELVRQFAREINAKLEWHWGGEQSQMEQLEGYELDLLLGGITRKTPWKSDIGLTSGYFDQHAFATPPGENGWIKRLDEFLHAHRAEIEEKTPR
jgi:polar amino acid transport system substrate-binding protein